jgi:DnaJ-domain-containing protein 1
MLWRSKFLQSTADSRNLREATNDLKLAHQSHLHAPSKPLGFGGQTRGRAVRRASCNSQLSPRRFRFPLNCHHDSNLDVRAKTTHYQTLGIPQEASAERLKHAYRSLVKACHPDLFPSGSEAQAKAQEQIRKVNAAYAVLSSPRKRASYDAKLNQQASSFHKPKPEHCDKCGKPTLYWHTNRDVALCNACAGRSTCIA